MFFDRAREHDPARGIVSDVFQKAETNAVVSHVELDFRRGKGETKPARLDVRLLCRPELQGALPTCGGFEVSHPFELALGEDEVRDVQDLIGACDGLRVHPHFAASGDRARDEGRRVGQVEPPIGGWL
ncbi:MAG TPA: hypothetical protein VGL81_31315 [Polyangiaceae bacterium]